MEKQKAKTLPEESPQDTQNDPVLPVELVTVSQLITFLAGIIISVGLVFLGGHALLFFLDFINPRFYTFFTTIQLVYVLYWIVLILFVYKTIYMAGFCVVDRNHNAVISFFDRRIKYRLEEGKHWLLPGVYSAEQIDMRLRDVDLEIKFLSSDNQMLVSTLTLQYVAYGELEYLSTQPGVTENGLEEVMTTASSLYGAETTLEAAAGDNKSSDRLKKFLIEALEQIEGEGLYISSWGILVKEIIAGQILPASEETIELLRLVAAERLQKQAEDKNTQTALKNLKKYVKAGMTMKEATIFYQKERGINTEEIVITSNSETSGFEKAEAIRQAGSKSK